MQLPRIDQAVIDLKKLTDYSLNPEHELGKHKARVFLTALGISLADAEWLREQILQGIEETEAVEGRLSPFGQTYVVDIPVTRGEMSAIIRTSWIVEHGTDFPRLTSCYVK